MENIRDKFIEVFSQIKRENSNIQGMIDYLDNSGFFLAPASTKYNNAFEGGLAQHSLNTYYTLKKLVESYYEETEYDLDGLIIVGLLHDISKANLFTKEIKNRKVYREDGSKYDDFGPYEWESYVTYNYREPKERFVFGNPEETSYYIISQYFPLTVDEAAALINCKGDLGTNTINKDLPSVFNRYHLAMFLYIADLISTYKEDINE